MAVEVIDRIKPKNGGSFPIVEAVDVEVSEGLRLPEALAAKANTSTTDNLQAQVDQIAQSAGAGTADTEIAQARVAADGTSYQTLKARLDTDDTKHSVTESEITENVDNLNGIFTSSNLLSLRTKVKNAYFAAEEVPNSSYDYYEFIPVKNGKTYRFGFSARYVSFFNISKEYVSNSESRTSFTASADGFVNVTVGHSVSASDIKMYENTEVKADVPTLNTGFKSDVTVRNLADNSTVEIITTATAIKSGYYDPTNGEFTQNSSYYTSEPINIIPGISNNKIRIRSSLFNDIGIVVFNSEMQVIFALNGTNAAEYGYTATTELQDIDVTVSNQARYIANAIRTPYYTSLESEMSIKYQKPIGILNENTVNNYNVVDGAITTEKLADKAAVKNIVSPGKNLLDLSKSTLNSVIEYQGTRVISYDGYDTSDYIDVSEFTNQICVSPRLRKLCQYTEDKTAITDTYVDNIESNYVCAVHSDAKYVRVSYFHDQANQMQVEDNTEPTYYEPYANILDNQINALNEITKAAVEQMLGEINDPLRGKKWYPCGDSFTDYTNATFDSGIFARKGKTYPRLIALRTGIIIDQDFFLAGRTMAYPADHTFTNSFTCPECPGYYQNIPEDADYITIMLGINDLNHINGSGTTPDGEDATGVIPIGTITDTTTDTYYGAYNTVLSWLRENRPYAHVGIIVTNGTQNQDYTNAQINVAKKWGYPYINLNGDERTPAMIRCYNPYMSEELKTQMKQIYGIDYPTDTHPNYKAHEYESTIIENWLRTL